MRSLNSARESWQELQTYNNLQDLKTAVRLEDSTSVATNGLRSACWKAFLLFETLEVDTWRHTLTSSRSAYNSLRSHFLRLIENPDEISSGSDPLSTEAESSPWAQLRKDEELRAEIKQDVDRCMPEIPYFRLPETRRILIDILFIYGRLNPDVGYKQGMHELLAHVLWVVEGGAIDLGETSKALGEDAIINFVFNAGHIEHDTFALFSQVMQSSKAFYVSEGSNSIAARCQHIFADLLPRVDPVLAKHLSDLEILPQVYLIRWVRLLFGREFDLDNVLTLWDVLFAEDPSLELVDLICVAMLLRSRWHLLDADYNGVLGVLLKPAEQDQEHPAQTFALDALYLRSHLDVEGASYLVLKYTGRPLSRPGRSSTPPALQRNITAFSGLSLTQSRSSGLSPSRSPRQGRNIEAILQDTAKSLRARSEKLGLGKAVWTAVDEVHRRAQEIRDAQTPSPPPWRRSGNAQLADRIVELESRNKRLSLLLSGAVSELWEYQKLIADNKSSENQEMSANDERSVEKLSAAIAKVQFVQVYLDEPGLALADDEAVKEKQVSEAAQQGVYDPLRASHEIQVTEGTPEVNVQSSEKEFSISGVAHLADPSSFEDFPESPITSTKQAPLLSLSEDRPAQRPSQTKTDHESGTVRQTPPAKPEAKRPLLEQSAYSFMLGQGSNAETRNVSFGERTDSSQDRSREKIALFGDERSPGKSPRQSDQHELGPGNGEEDEFDMRSLRRAKPATK